MEHFVSSTVLSMRATVYQVLIRCPALIVGLHSSRPTFREQIITVIYCTCKHGAVSISGEDCVRKIGMEIDVKA